MVITTSDLSRVRKEIQRLKKEHKRVIIQAHDPEFNRKILEIKDVDVLLSPEIHSRKDKLKERDSGLNEVLCRIAKKNNITIGIDLTAIKKLSTKEKIKVIERLKQNVFLCKKTGLELSFFPRETFSRQDLAAFIITLSGSTRLAQYAAREK